MRRRLVAFLTASLVALALGVTAATADPATDASTVVSSFLTASIAGDFPGMCAALTTSLKDALFDGKDCATELAASAAESSSNQAEVEDGLNIVASVAAQDASPKHRYFAGPAKKGVAQLAAKLAKQLRVPIKVGTQADAADLALDSFIVSRQTTATHLILYAHDPDSGTIYRGSSTPTSHGATVKPVGTGTKAVPPTETFQITQADPGASGAVYLAATLSETKDGTTRTSTDNFVCRLENGVYLIDDILVGIKATATELNSP